MAYHIVKGIFLALRLSTIKIYTILMGTVIHDLQASKPVCWNCFISSKLMVLHMKVKTVILLTSTRI